ncbi:MAG: Zn(II)2Cys6 transcription factor domain-containing protein [Waddliaceae bacterium]
MQGEAQSKRDNPYNGGIMTISIHHTSQHDQPIDLSTSNKSKRLRHGEACQPCNKTKLKCSERIPDPKGVENGILKCERCWRINKECLDNPQRNKVDVACDYCHKKKIRCSPLIEQSDELGKIIHKCQKCWKIKIDCTFTPKKGGSPRLHPQVQPNSELQRSRTQVKHKKQTNQSNDNKTQILKIISQKERLGKKLEIIEMQETNCLSQMRILQLIEYTGRIKLNQNRFETQLPSYIWQQAQQNIERELMQVLTQKERYFTYWQHLNTEKSNIQQMLECIHQIEQREPL